MPEYDGSDAVEVNKNFNLEDEKITNNNGLESTNNNPDEFENLNVEEKSNLQNLQNVTEKVSINKPEQASQVEKEFKNDDVVADILATVSRKITELEQAQHDLISAANNMNGAFNREEKNFADFAEKMDELFETVEIKLSQKTDLAVDEYINTFKKVTDIGNQNMKGFFRALYTYQQKLGKPITSQAQTIYYLTIVNSLLLIGNLVLSVLKGL